MGSKYDPKLLLEFYNAYVHHDSFNSNDIDV